MGKGAAGFTLMESMMALTLLAIGMLGLAGAFSQIAKSNNTISRKRLAAFLATTKLTQLRTTSLTKTEKLQGRFGKPFQQYSWNCQLEYQSNNKNIGDMLLEVKHKTGVGVKLWTKISIDHAQ